MSLSIHLLHLLSRLSLSLQCPAPQSTLLLLSPFQFPNTPLLQSPRPASKQSLFLNTLPRLSRFLHMLQLLRLASKQSPFPSMPPRLSLFPHTLLSPRHASRPKLLPSLLPPSQKHVTKPRPSPSLLPLSRKHASRPRLLPNHRSPLHLHATRLPPKHVTRLSPHAPQSHQVLGKVIESCKDAFWPLHDKFGGFRFC